MWDPREPDGGFLLELVSGPVTTAALVLALQFSRRIALVMFERRLGTRAPKAVAVLGISGLRLARRVPSNDAIHSLITKRRLTTALAR